MSGAVLDAGDTKSENNRLYSQNLHSNGKRRMIKNEHRCWVVMRITTNKADEVKIRLCMCTCIECILFQTRWVWEILFGKVTGISAVT